MQLPDRVWNANIVVLAVIVTGTIGYMTVEGWPLLDALYMTMITISTVGFHEVGSLDTPGRLLTIVLIVAGVGAVLYAGVTVFEWMLEGHLREMLGRRRVKRELENLSGHYIICGYGRTGEGVKAILEERYPVVVVEQQEEKIARLREQSELFVQGDATQDVTLEEAGIERASGLVSVVSSDPDNVFIVLSARGLNPDLKILARARDPATASKLHRAGADTVVSPFHIGATRLAQTVLRPHVVDFMDIATRQGEVELVMEEVPVFEGSRLVGVKLRETNIRQEVGLIIIAIRRRGGEGPFEFNPSPDAVIEAGDVLLSMGRAEDFAKLEEMAGS